MMDLKYLNLSCIPIFKKKPMTFRYEMKSLEELFNPAMQMRYPDIDMEKLRRNFEFIRLR